MDGSADVSDDRTALERTIGDDAVRLRTDLEAIVVRYENSPDRCTVVPRAGSDEEKLTTWLSADLDAFVELDEVR